MLCWRFACKPTRYLQALSVLLVCFVWWRRGITQGIGQIEKELHIRPPGRYHSLNIGKSAVLKLSCLALRLMRVRALCFEWSFAVWIWSKCQECPFVLLVVVCSVFPNRRINRTVPSVCGFRRCDWYSRSVNPFCFLFFGASFRFCATFVFRMSNLSSRRFWLKIGAPKACLVNLMFQSGKEKPSRAVSAVEGVLVSF